MSSCSRNESLYALVQDSTVNYSASVEFSPTERKTHSLDWDVSQGVSAEERIDLKTLYDDVNRNIVVESRALLGATQKYQLFQGYDFEQSFTTFDHSKIDIVVVVDNSSSIETEQAKLAQGFAQLIERVADKDWRIVIASHEAFSSCAAEVITKETPDPEIRFRDAIVSMGHSGSNEETPIFKTMRILQSMRLSRMTYSSPIAPCTALRPNVPVGVMMLTNEDECSNGFNCKFLKTPNTISAANYYRAKNLYFSETPYGDHYRIGAILWPTTSKNSCSSALRKAESIGIMLTNSYTTIPTWTKQYDICAPEFQSYLSDFSTVMQGMKNLYRLAPGPQIGNLVPVPGSVHAFINGVELAPGDFTIVKEGTVAFLQLLNAPSIGSTLTVRYQLPGEAARSEFIEPANLVSAGYTLRVVQRIAKNNVVIPAGRDTASSVAQINGTHYNEVTVGANKVIRFVTPIEPGEIVLVSLQKSIDAVTSTTSTGFTIGENLITEVPITVKKDGVPFELQNPQILKSGNIFSLKYDQIPTGSYIFSYRTLNDPKLSYNLTLPTGASITSVKDAESGVSVSYSIPDANHIAFPRDEIRLGRQILVTHNRRELVAGTLSLDDVTPISNSIKVEQFEGSDESCHSMGNDLLGFEDGAIKIRCPNPTGVTKVRFSYDTLTVLETFQADIPEWALKAGKGHWTFYLNGMPLESTDPRLTADSAGKVLVTGDFQEGDVIRADYSVP